MKEKNKIKLLGERQCKCVLPLSRRGRKGNTGGSGTKSVVRVEQLTRGCQTIGQR